VFGVFTTAYSELEARAEGVLPGMGRKLTREVEEKCPVFQTFAVL